MTTPRLLLIDTSASRCQVGFSGETLSQRFGKEERQSAQNLLPLIQELVDETETSLDDLNAVVVMAGPGSFTGLRIGVGVAQALSFSNATPGIALSNLAVLALAATKLCSAETLLVALPAREGEYYFGAYQVDSIDGVKLLGQEQVAKAADLMLPAKLDNVALVGEGWQADGGLSLAQLSLDIVAVEVAAGVTLEIMAELASSMLSRGAVRHSSELRPNYIKEHLDY